ncbi:hypothetical protein LMG28688_03080 [Paraburkholderia caffeinitolerans]|uniref:Fimbrial assembly protein PilN n=1 Tax=Paraburkholderia caffeinitolerans TaxID=1723730 RepID=A0A6J5G0Y7_9BURK|nr:MULTISPECIES: fimbrial assembly protein [Paraburkholderia]CAB3790271.1 hypothetical protein LMG28688_03080 [Paraburkholderia caffeinitolerans]
MSARAGIVREQIVVPGMWSDGFNLLPWRSGAMRRLRRRRAVEWLAALIVGGACGSAVAGWQLFERTRVEARREAIDQQLARLAVPLALAHKLEREADARRAARSEAQQRAKPLAHVFALIDALSRARTAGVVLEQLAQRVEETELHASATNEAAAAAWLASLHAIPGVEAVDVRELKRPQETALMRERTPLGASPSVALTRAPIRIAVRLVWKGVAANAVGAARSAGAKGAK